MKKNLIIKHLDKRLKMEEGFSFPFRVLHFKPFPDYLYPSVVANLPQDDCYQDLPHEDAMRSDGTSTRKVMLLDKSAPLFWSYLSFILCSIEVENIFRKHLDFDQPVRAVCRLLRDFAGYKIKPHPDSSKKACTVQFYLPSDESQFDLGTSFYSRNVDNSFEEIYKLTFLPNTGYGFKVTDKSWHGTNFQVLNKPRDSLILTYYKDETSDA